MKNKYFILAAAALALAACSNDETVESAALSESNAISFRPFVEGQTRADGIDQTALRTKGFKVFAIDNGQTDFTTKGYFPETLFEWSNVSNTYTSADKRYWPTSGSLDFYAYSPATSSQITNHVANSKAFTIQPAALSSAASASGQIDFVYGSTLNKDKSTYATGVPLNFRHAMSKVIIKLKNSNSSLLFTVGDVKIGNLRTSDTYTYNGSTLGTATDGNGSAKLKYSDWSHTGGQTGSYSLTMSKDGNYNVFSGVIDAKTVPTATPADYEMILIPQDVVVRNVYNGASTSPASTFEGTYISVELKAQNAIGSQAYVIGNAGTYVEAMWPLNTLEMDPGYAYTFTVDLAGGGYYIENQDTDADLDPILEGAEIKFVDVNVDAWDTAVESVITNATYAKGGAYTLNLPTNTTGNVYLTVNGLTPGNTITVIGTVDCTSPVLSSSTVGTGGTATITCPLAGNGSGSTSVITLTEKDSGSNVVSTTTINLVQAAP